MPELPEADEQICCHQGPKAEEVSSAAPARGEDLEAPEVS